MAGMKRGGRGAGAELAVQDRPEVVPPPVPDTVIEEVFEALSEVQREAKLQAAVATGKILVEKFFGGSFTDWRDRGQNDASIRKLADKFTRAGQRGFSASNLSRTIGVYELAQREGVSTWKHVGVSHVRTVLKLPEEEQKRLLTAAEEKNWSVVKLDEEAKKAAPKDPDDRRGRPPLPEWVKALNAVTSGPLDHVAKTVTAESVGHYSPAKAQALLEQVESQIAGLQKLADAVKQAMEQWQASVKAD